MTAYQDFIAAGNPDSAWEKYQSEFNAAFRLKQQQKLDAIQEIERLKTEKLEKFLSRFSKLQAGRLRKCLLASLQINGVLNARHLHAENLAARGYTKDGDKLKDCSAGFFIARDVTQVLIDYVEFLQSL